MIFGKSHQKVELFTAYVVGFAKTPMCFIKKRTKLEDLSGFQQACGFLSAGDLVDNIPAFYIHFLSEVVLMLVEHCTGNIAQGIDLHDSYTFFARGSSVVVSR